VWEHPEVDVEYAWARYANNGLMAAYACPDRWKIEYFDPELEEVMGRFRGDQNRYVELFDWSRDERLWIVNTESDVEGVAWYLYDKETKQERLLSGADLANPRDRLAPMQPIRFAAQDGLEIHGYLTVPVGSTGTNLPLVVTVHDGPWDRSYWSFDREAQFLANRGYAVLDVNFRGSSGYGTSFERAGVGEFARAMHSDILDAVSWAVSEGVADPDRVAIYGWGYGGYEALVAASFTPDVFAAAIDAAGTPDWEQALDSLPPYMQTSRLGLRTFIGDPATSEGLEALRAASAIHHIDRIVRPLLVVQGGNDAWGIQGQVEAMVSRLRERDAPVAYLLLENEGRSIQNWENHLRFYRALEGFLAKHLGGRVSPVTADEMWLGLQ
jgi:dipeptidyl aminopeptidase/acylaminoacyl peptidase